MPKAGFCVGNGNIHSTATACAELGVGIDDEIALASEECQGAVGKVVGRGRSTLQESDIDWRLGVQASVCGGGTRLPGIR